MRSIKEAFNVVRRRTSLLFYLLCLAFLFGGGECQIPPAGEGEGEGELVGLEDADVVRGGLLYDKWWSEAGLSAPTEDHPLWATRPDQDSNTRTGADTWRCKECHGWDYKGVDGAYGSGSHRTGFAGIFGVTDATIRAKFAQASSAQNVFDTIKTDHSYGTVLSDEDILDLTKFVFEGQLDTDDIIDGNDAFIGVAATGQTSYDSTCAVCHGADGLTPPPGADAGFDDFPGAVATANPWEMQHKISFGQPDTLMPAQLDDLTVEEIGDLGAYLQTLPTQ